MTADPRIPLVSATGSIPMGRVVGQTVAARLGRSLLELGGNNAIIITPKADLDGRPGHRLRRRGHGGAAMHLHPAPHRPRGRLRRGPGPAPEGIYEKVTIGEPPRGRHPRGAPHRPGRGGCHAGRPRAGQGRGREGRVHGGEVLSTAPALRAPGARRGREPLRDRAGGDLRADPLPDPLPGARGRPESALALHNGVRQGLSSAIFTWTCARPRPSSRTWARTAGSPT
jgi:aldehyde dehydrogenase (NAD+)